MHSQENSATYKNILRAAFYPAIYFEKRNGQERFRRSQPLEGSIPNAHNIAPLERASGYGNTAGTTLLRGAALK